MRELTGFNEPARWGTGKASAGEIKGALLLLGGSAREQWTTSFIDGVSENSFDLFSS